MSQARKLDQFYTKKEIAKNFIDAVLDNIKSIKGKKLFLEPSAGAGAFYHQLPRNKLGFDLEPKCNGVICADYLSVDVAKYAGAATVITIGNPPFGKNSSLALKFINHSAKYSKIIAFILPRTFLKDSLSNKIDRNFHKIYEADVPKDSFVFEGRSYDVPCVFQIWEKRGVERIKKVEAICSPDFEFVSRESADFAIRRVGGLAGKIIINFSKYSSASHYFIKSKIDKKLLIKRLGMIDFSIVKNNTAGNPSIGKRELVELYSKIP